MSVTRYTWTDLQRSHVNGTGGEPAYFVDADLYDAVVAIYDDALKRIATLEAELAAEKENARRGWELFETFRDKYTEVKFPGMTGTVHAGVVAARQEPCRIYEYDGAFRCIAHKKSWGAITNPDTPCAGFVAPKEP